MAIRVVMFDIGGILEITPVGGDPTAIFPRMFARWEERLHMQPGELEAKLATVDARIEQKEQDGTLTEAEWQEEVRAALGLDQAQLADFVRDFWDVYLGDPNHDMIAYFAGLRPRYRTAILSNSFTGAREREQERYHFGDMADLIIYSHEEGMSKPDPRIFTLACERLGVQPNEILFLDDVPANVAAARSIGIHAILFQDTAQAIRDLQAALAADAHS